MLVEDVTTAGTSIRETMPMIKARPDTEVVGLVVSVDRMERGTGERSALAELEEAYGFVAAPIVNLEDLLGYLRDKAEAGVPVISDEHYGKMIQYYETYGGK